MGITATHRIPGLGNSPSGPTPNFSEEKTKARNISDSPKATASGSPGGGGDDTEAHALATPAHTAWCLLPLPALFLTWLTLAHPAGDGVAMQQGHCPLHSDRQLFLAP